MPKGWPPKLERASHRDRFDLLDCDLCLLGDQFQITADLRVWCWFSKQETLGQIAVRISKNPSLGLGLNTLSNHVAAEVVSHPNQGGDDHSILLSKPETLYENSREANDIEATTTEKIRGPVADTKVLKCDADALGLQLLQQGQRRFSCGPAV